MTKSFLNSPSPILTVILQCEDPDTAIARIRNASCLGAEAFGLQVESLDSEFHNPEVIKRIIDEMKDKPCYATNYRTKSNSCKSDDELAEGILTLADCGATLCDVMGDLFCKDPEELTMDQNAIDSQRKLIDALHEKGAEVLISSHLYKFAPAERVLEIAYEQKKRGADIIKIVTAAEDMTQQIENLRILNLLKEQLGAPFLFLANGKSSIHRRIGEKLGNCMTLCVYEHDVNSTRSQPLLSVMKTLRDKIDF